MREGILGFGAILLLMSLLYLISLLVSHFPEIIAYILMGVLPLVLIFSIIEYILLDIKGVRK